MKIDIQKLKETLSQKTEGLQFADRNELSDYVHQTIEEPIEKDAAEIAGVNWLHAARCDYIENMDEMNDCISDFVNEANFS